jgi:hypothetical protein
MHCNFLWSVYIFERTDPALPNEATHLFHIELPLLAGAAIAFSFLFH